MSDTYSVFLYPGVTLEGKVREQSTGFASITLTLQQSGYGEAQGVASVREIVLYYKPELVKALEEIFRSIGLSLTVQRINQEDKARKEAEALVKWSLVEGVPETPLRQELVEDGPKVPWSRSKYGPC